MRWSKAARWGVAALVCVTGAWLLLPDAPNYDTATHLVWAGDVLDGRAPQVTAPSAPTLHPLWLLACTAAVATGGGAELLQLVTIAALASTVWCVFLLAKEMAGRTAGLAAAVFCGSSFALLLLAFKAYADLPFLALVTAALALEVQRGPLNPAGGAAVPRTAIAVPALLFAAGLLRPEAWGVGLLLVALRAGEPVRRRSLVLWAGLVLAAPAVWILLDLALTDDGLHSLTGTRELAAKLDRTTGLDQAPLQAVLLTTDLIRPPVALLSLAGLALTSARWRRRPVAVPLATLLTGAAGFLVIGAAGLPLLQRYIQLPGLMLCVFAGAAVGSAVSAARSPQTSRHVRPLIVAGMASAVLLAGGYVVAKAGSFATLADGVMREARWHRQGGELLRTAAVRQWRRCGPVTLPSYRLVPELTITGGLHSGTVVSRAESFGGVGGQAQGVAIVIEGDRAAKRRLAWAPGVPRSSNQAPRGFAVIARRGPFTAYGSCTGAIAPRRAASR